jgi:LmbE family N-acetylglucosaminyl deacetylase
MQKWIYLSPHLDDVAISCGGLVWEQVRAGDRVEIWTLCTGDPPPGPLSTFAQELHFRWQTGREAASIRRLEDRHACLELGATWRHLSIPDCIYRTDAQGNHLYTSEQALFGDLQAADSELVEKASCVITERLTDQDNLVSPLAIGNHVDHQLTRAAAEAVGRPLWYYADYPYTHERPEEIQKLSLTGWEVESFPVSEDALQAWARAVSAHQSQISSFWSGGEELLAELRAYRGQMDGVRLWRTCASP